MHPAGHGVTTSTVTQGSDRPQLKIVRNEFPRFDQRVSDYHYDQRRQPPTTGS